MFIVCKMLPVLWAVIQMRHMGKGAQKQRVMSKGLGIGVSRAWVLPHSSELGDHHAEQSYSGLLNLPADSVTWEFAERSCWCDMKTVEVPTS